MKIEQKELPEFLRHYHDLTELIVHLDEIQDVTTRISDDQFQQMEDLAAYLRKQLYLYLWKSLDDFLDYQDFLSDVLADYWQDAEAFVSMALETTTAVELLEHKIDLDQGLLVRNSPKSSWVKPHNLHLQKLYSKLSK